jgi:hypothetical protein
MRFETDIAQCGDGALRRRELLAEIFDLENDLALLQLLEARAYRIALQQVTR